MSVVTVKHLLEAGVHFGHYTNRWDPRMKPYIYTARNGIYIIDLQKTEVLIEEAYQAMLKIAREGGKVLFVGTKKQAQEAVKEVAKKTGQYYVDNRWLGGTLTNFKTIRSRIKYLEEINKLVKTGEINNYPKKEIQDKLHQKEKLESYLTGIKDMIELPKALFIVDPRKEENAIKEAKKLNIPVFGICDTNANPEVLDFVIPSNDDGIRAVQLIIRVMGNAIIEGTASGVEPFVLETLDENNGQVEKVERRRNETRSVRADFSTPRKTTSEKTTETKEVKAAPKEEVKKENSAKKETKAATKKVASEETKETKTTAKIETKTTRAAATKEAKEPKTAKTTTIKKESKTTKAAATKETKETKTTKTTTAKETKTTNKKATTK